MIYEGMCCYNKWYKNGYVIILRDIRTGALLL